MKYVLRTTFAFLSRASPASMLEAATAKRIEGCFRKRVECHFSMSFGDDLALQVVVGVAPAAR